MTRRTVKAAIARPVDRPVIAIDINGQPITLPLVELPNILAELHKVERQARKEGLLP